MKNNKVTQPKKNQKKPAPVKSPQQSKQNTEQESLDNVMRKAAGVTTTLSPAEVVHLSRQIGNRATGKLLKNQNSSISPPGTRRDVSSAVRLSVQHVAGPGSLQRKLEGQLSGMSNPDIIAALKRIYGNDIVVRPYQINQLRERSDKTYSSLAELGVVLELSKKETPQPPTGGGVKPPGQGVKPPGQGVKPPGQGVKPPPVGGGVKPPGQGVKPQPTGGGEKPPEKPKLPETEQKPLAKSGEQTQLAEKKQAEVLENPELRKEHQGKKLYISAGKKIAVVTGGKIESLTSSFSDPVEVSKLQDVIRETNEIPAKRSVYEVKGGKVGTASFTFGADIEVNVDQRGVKNGDTPGSIVSYGKDQYWVAQKDLVTKSMNGTKVKYFDKTFWVPQGHLEEVGAEWVKKTGDLFPEPPKPEDTLQGKLGDCFLMAALSSIVKNDSGFPSKLIKDNKDGTVTVHLYEVTGSSESYYSSGEKTGEYASSGKFKATPKDITVEKSVAEIKGEALYAQKYLWVQLVEKAYAAGGFPKGLLAKGKSGSFEDLTQGGKSKQAFEIFLGHEASFTQLEQRKKQGAGVEDKILAEIADALKKKQAVAAGTRKFTADEQKQAKAEGVGHSAGEGKLRGIVDEHAYTVLEVNPQKKTLKLRNPWGEYGRTLDGQAVEKGGGIVDITMADFMKWFNTVSYSGQVTKVNP